MSRKTTKCSRPRQVLPGLLQPLVNQGIDQHQHGCRHTQQTQMEITTSPIPLYRAEPLNKTLLQGGSLEPRQSVRLPSNLPYVVDNLWEVMRPQHMPSRRHALYASTTPELAMTNCSANDQGQGFMVYQLVIDGPYSIAQIRQEDARDHPDKKTIAKLIQRYQAQISDAHDTERPWIALLFMPGANQDDWDLACQKSSIAQDLAKEMKALSTFWNDAGPPSANCKGELFMQLHKGSSYRAHQPKTYNPKS